MELAERIGIQGRKDMPDFKPGDLVRIWVKVKEEKERTQIFEGTVISRRGSGPNETFTVRRLSYGVGIERTFPVQASVVERMKVIRQGKVKRGKLYYLRGKKGKESKVETEAISKGDSTP